MYESFFFFYGRLLQVYHRRLSVIAAGVPAGLAAMVYEYKGEDKDGESSAVGSYVAAVIVFVAESFMSRLMFPSPPLPQMLLLLKVITTYDTLASDFSASGGQVRQKRRYYVTLPQ